LNWLALPLQLNEKQEGPEGNEDLGCP